jgi:hypothetical protein
MRLRNVAIECEDCQCVILDFDKQEITPPKHISEKRRYLVTVYRTGYSSRDIEVSAFDELDAANEACDAAGNYDFKESNAEYEAEFVREIKEEENANNQD